MKKILLILSMLLLPMFIYAKGSVDVSPTSLQITVGSTKTFTVKTSNSAGRIDIASSNTGVATISSSSIFLDNQSQKITVTAKKVGTSKITVKATDVTTYDDESLSGKTYIINVTVVDKPKTTLSNNNKLKGISITDYKLEKVSDKYYTLEVESNVESVYLNATAEDSKAKIKGSGSHKLEYGENNIELVITSESGVENTITVLVVRKFETQITEPKEENKIEDEKDNNDVVETNEEKLTDNIWFIVSIVEFLIIFILIIRRKK